MTKKIRTHQDKMVEDFIHEMASLERKCRDDPDCYENRETVSVSTRGLKVFLTARRRGRREPTMGDFMSFVSILGGHNRLEDVKIEVSLNNLFSLLSNVERLQALWVQAVHDHSHWEVVAENMAAQALIALASIDNKEHVDFANRVTQRVREIMNTKRTEEAMDDGGDE